jgi:hypothetical protein
MRNVLHFVFDFYLFARLCDVIRLARLFGKFNVLFRCLFVYAVVYTCLSLSFNEEALRCS